MKLLSVAILSLSIFSASVVAEEYQEHDGMLMNHGDGHLMDMAGGMVMGQNSETLPGGCDKIAENREITVHAGHKYAEKFPGRMYAFDTQEFNFKPCTKLTVHFVNDDHIRHQWMMHGLPKYLYPKGMFHLEISGPGKISGTLILPPGDKTYLVHCDIAQHMEKGMKAQLKVGKGDGNLPSIPGLTAYIVADDYNATLADLEEKAKNAVEEPAIAPAMATTSADPAVSATTAPTAANEEPFMSGVTIIGLAIGLLLAPFLATKFQGMTTVEVITTVFKWLRTGIDVIVGLVARIFSPKNKILPEK